MYNRKTLEFILEQINAKTKEKYSLNQVMGGYGLYVRTNGRIEVSDFGYDGCISAKEMYFYLSGLLRALHQIQLIGAKKLLKPKK